LLVLIAPVPVLIICSAMLFSVMGFRKRKTKRAPIPAVYTEYSSA
jgi:hypothetical protein